MVGRFQRTASVSGLDCEVPQIASAFHQRAAHKGAARKAGGQHQVPARCLGVQIAGGVHQHAPHAAVQAVWMGAEMGQQVIEPAVHAAFIQGDDKQEPLSRQRTLQAGQHLCLPPRQGRLQHSGAPGGERPAGADHRQFFRYADHLLPASGCIPAEPPPGARGKAACSGRYDETRRQPPAK